MIPTNFFDDRDVIINEVIFERYFNRIKLSGRKLSIREGKKNRASKEMIIHEFSRPIEDTDFHKSMNNVKNPFGDGTAAKKNKRIYHESM